MTQTGYTGDSSEALKSVVCRAFQISHFPTQIRVVKQVITEVYPASFLDQFTRLQLPLLLKNSAWYKEKIYITKAEIGVL